LPEPRAEDEHTKKEGAAVGQINDEHGPTRLEGRAPLPVKASRSQIRGLPMLGPAALWVFDLPSHDADYDITTDNARSYQLC